MRNHLVIVPLSALLLSSALPTAAQASTGPSVTSLSAAAGPLVGGGRLTLHGSGFSHVTKVLFGGAAAHGVHVISSHTLTALVPRHKPATVNVRVVTTAATSKTAKANRFTYVAPPSVSGLSIPSGTTGGGARVVLRGKQFLHVHTVLFGASKGLAVHVTSSTSLSVTSPAHIPGIVDVRVVTAYGTSARRTPDHFTFAAATVTAPIPPGSTPTPTPTQPIQKLPPAPVLPVISTVALPAAVQGVRYSGITFTATAGTPPYTWSADDLPGGLVLSAAGVLSGTTRATAGVKQLQVTVSDSAHQSVTTVVPLSVKPFGGQLYAWGDNSGGQVGDGSTTNADVPTKIKGLPSVISVCSTMDDGIAVESDGTVWGWGSRGGGVPGSDSGEVLSPVKLAGIPSAVAATCGMDTEYVLTSAGTVYAWGSGSSGQLGNGGLLFDDTPAEIAGLDHVVAVGSSFATAYAVRDDGTVFGWGQNDNGFIGDGSTGDVLTPIPIPGISNAVGVATGISGNETWVVCADGTVYGWGGEAGDALGDGAASGSELTPVKIAGLQGIVQLSTGYGTTYALSDNGTVLAWGENQAGQLGDGKLQDPPSPVAVSTITGVEALGTGESAAYALLSDGTVDGWGFNADGEVGDGTTTQRTTPVAVSGLKNVVALGVSPSGDTGYAVEDQIASGVPIPPVH